MFEKEAESKAIETCPLNLDMPTYAQGFVDGTEFGYNKANEWHYPSKGELPGESEEEIKEKGEKVYAIFKNNSYYIVDRAAVKNYEDLIAWTELPTFTKA